QGEPARVAIDYEILKPDYNLFMHISVWHRRGQVLAHSKFSDCDHIFCDATSTGRKRLHFEFDTSFFHPGEYIIRFEVCRNAKQKIADEVLLRLPIYGSEGVSGACRPQTESDSITLGNKWSLKV